MSSVLCKSLSARSLFAWCSSHALCSSIGSRLHKIQVAAPVWPARACVRSGFLCGSNYACGGRAKATDCWNIDTSDMNVKSVTYKCVHPLHEVIRAGRVVELQAGAAFSPHELTRQNKAVKVGPSCEINLIQRVEENWAINQKENLA